MIRNDHIYLTSTMLRQRTPNRDFLGNLFITHCGEYDFKGAVTLIFLIRGSLYRPGYFPCYEGHRNYISLPIRGFLAGGTSVTVG